MSRIGCTLDGTDPRAAGGVVNPSAKACQPSVPCAGGQQIFARLKRDNRWSVLVDDGAVTIQVGEESISGELSTHRYS